MPPSRRHAARIPVRPHSSHRRFLQCCQPPTPQEQTKRHGCHSHLQSPWRTTNDAECNLTAVRFLMPAFALRDGWASVAELRGLPASASLVHWETYMNDQRVNLYDGAYAHYASDAEPAVRRARHESAKGHVRR